MNEIDLFPRLTTALTKSGIPYMLTGSFASSFHVLGWAQAARVDALAAREVWKALGVPDRMGAVEENISHCQWHQAFTPALEAYVEKFLLDKKDGASTDVLRSKFTDIDRANPWTTPNLK